MCHHDIEICIVNMMGWDDNDDDDDDIELDTKK